MGPVSIVLAVDGGGSKTDVAAIALNGELVAHAHGEGSSPQRLGWPTVRPLLDGLRAQVLREAGDRPILATHVYLCGLDLPEELAEARSQLAHWGSAVVDNDLFALLRAGTLAPDAVAVVCGTGINAVGVRADGATARFSALGDIAGDWGGGAFLGARALWHAARAEDGRGRSTVLSKSVPAAFGMTSVAQVTEALHFRRLPAYAVNRLCPVLFDAAAAGDEVAREVVDRQAEEIALLATAAMRRLGLLGEVVPVVLGGGVLAAQRDLLGGAVVQRLRAAAPKAVPSWVTAPPVLGAGFAALEAAGAGVSAFARYRAQLG